MSAANRSRVIQQTVRKFVKLRLLWIILVAFLLLSGCVRDDVNLSFRDANHGTLTQRVRVSSRLVGISQVAADLWLEKLIEQTAQMGGKVQHPSERDWLLTMPFHSVQDLGQKFKQLQGLVERQSGQPSSLKPVSNLQITTNNLIIWQRHHLSYDLDLRSLGVLPTVNNKATILIDPNDLLVLEFELKTPWGARLPKDRPAETRLPNIYRKGRQLVWTLKPGEANHLEAVFWLPSSVGIGGGLIAGLVLVGMFLKAWISPASQPVAAAPLVPIKP